MTQMKKMIGVRLAAMLSGFAVPSFKREEGQTLAEYALILALIAVVVVVAVGFLSGQISSLFSQVGSVI
jgi:Flp pilus assembly pilin Flp